MATGHPAGNFSHERETEAREIRERMQPNGDGFWFHPPESPTIESEHLLHGLAGPNQTTYPPGHRFTHSITADREYRDREAKHLSSVTHNLHGSAPSSSSRGQKQSELARDLAIAEENIRGENCTVIPPRSRAEPGRGDVWLGVKQMEGRKEEQGARSGGGVGKGEGADRVSDFDKEVEKEKIRQRAEGVGGGRLWVGS